MESLHKFMAEKRTPMGPPPRMGFQKGVVLEELKKLFNTCANGCDVL